MTVKVPNKAGGELRPESPLHEVLTHGPALSASYGRLLGGLLLLVALNKASKGSLGFVALASLVISLSYRFLTGGSN
jgi:hypothetical protein